MPTAAIISAAPAPARIGAAAKGDAASAQDDFAALVVAETPASGGDKAISTRAPTGRLALAAAPKPSAASIGLATKPASPAPSPAEDAAQLATVETASSDAKVAPAEPATKDAPIDADATTATPASVPQAVLTVAVLSVPVSPSNAAAATKTAEQPADGVAGNPPTVPVGLPDSTALDPHAAGSEATSKSPAPSATAAFATMALPVLKGSVTNSADAVSPRSSETGSELASAKTTSAALDAKNAATVLATVDIAIAPIEPAKTNASARTGEASASTEAPVRPSPEPSQATSSPTPQAPVVPPAVEARPAVAPTVPAPTVPTDGLAAPLVTAPPPPVAANVSVPTPAAHFSSLSTATIETTARLSAQITRQLNGRATRFEMGLTPEGLGRVNVRLDIDAEGRLTAQLAFDNPLAATDLRGRADELRSQLQDAGFKLAPDALTFSQRDPSAGDDPSQQHSRHQNRAFAAGERLGSDADVTPPAWISLSLKTSSGVDMKV